MFDRLTVSTRLLVAFGGATLMLVCIAALAVQQLQHLAALAGTPAAAQASTAASAWIAGLAAAAALGGLVVAVALTRSLARALGAEPRTLGDCARRVAQGDLAAGAGAAPQHGVMADLERMRRQLLQLVGAVQAQAAAVAETGGRIARSSAALDERSQAQGEALRAAAERLHAVNTLVQSTAHRAAQTGVQTGEARQAADEGHAAITAVAGAMERLQADSRRIDQITGLIDGLAFQTGVLALNAAAAAKRAGDAGRDFGVVAQEVRKLAQQSTASAAQVKALVAASAMRMREGQGSVQLAQATMARIRTAVQCAAEQVEVMGQASGMQSSALGAISQAVGRLDADTHDSRRLAGVNADASRALDRQAADLLAAVEAFRVSTPAAPAGPRRGAMLDTTPSMPHDKPVHAPGRRPLQPGRG